MTTYRPTLSQPSDSKKEEFRKYLENSGVFEILSKALVALFEEQEKPADALEYVRNFLGKTEIHKYEIEIQELRIENQKLRSKLDLMEKKN